MKLIHSKVLNIQLIVTWNIRLVIGGDSIPPFSSFGSKDSLPSRTCTLDKLQTVAMWLWLRSTWTLRTSVLTCTRLSSTTPLVSALGLCGGLLERIGCPLKSRHRQCISLRGHPAIQRGNESTKRAPTKASGLLLKRTKKATVVTKGSRCESNGNWQLPLSPPCHGVTHTALTATHPPCQLAKLRPRHSPGPGGATTKKGNEALAALFAANEPRRSWPNGPVLLGLF